MGFSRPHIPIFDSKFHFPETFGYVDKFGYRFYIKCSHTLLFTLYFSKLFKKSILLTVYVFKVAGCVANGVDPDQTPRFAASDLGLHNLLGLVRSSA